MITADEQIAEFIEMVKVTGMGESSCGPFSKYWIGPYIRHNRLDGLKCLCGWANTLIVKALISL